MLDSFPFRPAASKRHRAYHEGGFRYANDGTCFLRRLLAWYATPFRHADHALTQLSNMLPNVVRSRDGLLTPDEIEMWLRFK
jgi:hypothetical protein